MTRLLNWLRSKSIERAKLRKQEQAWADLARLTARRRNSPEVESFRAHRRAALKATRKAA